LAGDLETNPRNIPEYVKELRLIGFDIEPVHGKYGGYVLNRDSTFPAVRLSDAEREAFMAGFEYLLLRNDFMEIENYKKAMQKVSSAIINRDSIIDETMLAYRFPLKMPQEELEKRYFAIQQCIVNKTVLDIEYLSQKNEVTKRTIHPYKLFMYNNAWFVLGFDESKGDIRYFKLNRIQDFAVQHRKFVQLLTYKESDYLDEYGMKNNGEWYPIKLKLTGNYAMLVKERIYGKDQTLEEVDDKTTILSVKMQNKENILVFVLGFGANCEVLEPEWLKEKLIDTIKRMGLSYEQ
jgi:predicted DNA-binding transcriptional regulator YafY